MGELLQPLVCISEAALPAAEQAAKSISLELDDAIRVRRILGLAGQDKKMPGIIAFGGVQFGALTVDDGELTYRVVQDTDGTVFPLGAGRPLPKLDRQEERITEIICPEPTSWTSAGLAAAYIKGQQQGRLPFDPDERLTRSAVLMTLIGVPVALAGGAALPKLTNLPPGPALTLGSAGGLLLGGVVAAPGAVSELRRHHKAKTFANDLARRAGHLQSFTVVDRPTS